MAKTKTAKKKQPAGEHTDEEPASSLMDLVKTDPLEALTLGGAALQTLDERYERRRSKLLGVAYAVACRLYREWPEWKKFVRAELWKRLTKKPRLHKDRRVDIRDFNNRSDMQFYSGRRTLDMSQKQPVKWCRVWVIDHEYIASMR